MKKPKISIKKIDKSCKLVSSMLKSMAHPKRLIILGHLVSGEKTVSELVEKCSISQSQLSQFLARMKKEELLESRRNGTFQYYSIKDNRLIDLMALLQDKFCA